MAEKKRRPVEQIIVERINWLENQCKDKNNTLQGDNFDNPDVRVDDLNAAFVKAIRGLRGTEDYLLSDAPSPPGGSDG